MRLESWYCAAWSGELARGSVGRKLLGRHVVLFRDAGGAARALGARCPHRGADLAQGAVVDGCLQCPFHGWRFDGLGRCVRVPSQPESLKISAAARVPAFPLLERQGALWIWMGAGQPETVDPPDPPLRETGRAPRRIYFDAQLIPSPFLNTLENAFDKAHVPFIHRGTFGSDQDPLVARQRIRVEPDGRGLRAEDDPDSPWHAEPKALGGWLSGVARLLGLRAPVEQYTRFDVSGSVELYQRYPNGTYDLFVAHLTPADEEGTWLFVESVRTRAPHAFGDWIQRRVLGKLFDEGKRETSLILGADADGLPRPVSVESDRLGLAARQLYERWAYAKTGDPQCVSAGGGIEAR